MKRICIARMDHKVRIKKKRIPYPPNFFPIFNWHDAMLNYLGRRLLVRRYILDYFLRYPDTPISYWTAHDKWGEAHIWTQRTRFFRWIHA